MFKAIQEQITYLYKEKRQPLLLAIDEAQYLSTGILRITVHYNYAGLSDDEVSKYLLHKLQLAGASSTIIDPAALVAAHSFTQGNPRLIDNLMTDALTIGSQQGKKVIDAEIIRAAVDNQGLY